MKKVIIVAATRDLAIGNGTDQLYYIREDLQHFKALTLGHPIIMGRRTFEALPKGALPGRRNIVVTRRSGYQAPGAETAGSLEEAYSLCSAEEVIYIIGGGEIYRNALPDADEIALTLIDAERPDASVRFPSIPLPADISFDHTDPKTDLRFTFLTIT